MVWAAPSRPALFMDKNRPTWVIQKQIQIAVKVVRVAGMADDAVAVVVLFIEPEFHPVDGGIMVSGVSCMSSTVCGARMRAPCTPRLRGERS